MTHPTGLAMPVGVTLGGRARLATKDEQLTKIIGLHLSYSDSENPYQDIGIGKVVFEINDPRLEPSIRARLSTLFRRLEGEGRARLSVESVAFIHEGAVTELAFEYWNLRTNEKKPFRGIVDAVTGRVTPQ